MSDIGLLICLGATLLVGWALLTWAARWSAAHPAQPSAGKRHRRRAGQRAMGNTSAPETWWNTVADERSGWTNGDFLSALDVLDTMDDER
jgi:hypothetical protein